MVKISIVTGLILLALSSSGQVSSSVQLEEIIKLANQKKNPNEAYDILKNGLTLIDQASDSLRERFYFDIGVASGKLYKFDSSKIFLREALEYSRRIGDTLIIIGSMNALGNVARGESSNEEAQRYFEEALELTVNSSKREILQWKSKLLGNLAGIFFDLQQTEAALEYSFDAYRNAFTLNDSAEMSQNLIRMGYCLSVLGKMDSALHANRMATVILENRGDSLSLIYQYFNIGSIYKQSGKLEKAREAFIKCRAMALKFGELETMAGAINAVAQIEYSLKDYDKAFKKALEGLEIARENALLTHMRRGFELLYKIELERNNLAKAIVYLNQFHEVKDSVQNSETLKSISEFKVKYETAEKEKEIERLNFENQLAQAENSRKFILMVALSVVLLVVIVASVILYRNQKQKHRLEQQALSGEISELRIQIRELLGKYEGEIDIEYETLNDQLVNPLSNREFDIFRLIFTQKTNREISEELHVSINTVKTHLKNIYTKLGVSNRNDALKLFLRD
jgi:ATP/maltotriose-dependent transcriptional regulator MalT